MKKMRQLAVLAGFASLPFIPTAAFAAPCVGFTDVDDADAITGPFCVNVEWIRNRGVTLGCSATQYCPFDNVSRLQMAAFMQRLGDALTPAVLTQTDVIPAFSLSLPETDVNAHLCKTTPYTVTGYPRRAIIYAQMSGRSDGTVEVFGSPSISTNNGVSYARIAPAGIGMRSTATGTTWMSLTQTSALDLNVGTTYIFAYFVQRDVTDGGTANLTGGRCNMTIQIGSRTGGTSPRDTDAGGWVDNAR